MNGSAPARHLKVAGLFVGICGIELVEEDRVPTEDGEGEEDT